MADGRNERSRAMSRAAALVAGLMLIVAAGRAGAGAAGVEEAVHTLQQFQIVRGDPSGQMRLGDTITRAEMARILVAAAGKDGEAARPREAQPFADTGDHWAAGYVAAARDLGLAAGYPDGSFRPQAPVSYAEAVTMLLRVAGVPPAAGPWPDNYLAGARAAGIIPPEFDLAGTAADPAARGLVFLLAHRAFSVEQEGLNLYQRVFDRTPPALALDAVAGQTEAAALVVSGKVEGAAVLAVNGRPVPFGLDGSFAVPVDLDPGENLIAVAATDAAGNTATRAVTVRRVQPEAPAPVRIVAPARLTVQSGQAASLAATVLDQAGREMADAPVSGSVDPPELGSFDAATRTFRAGAAAGRGTLTLASGAAAASVAVTVAPGPLAGLTVTPGAVLVGTGEAVTITVQGADAAGNPVPAGPTLAVAGEGAAIRGSTFVATRPGTYTITATAGEVAGTATIDVYGDVARLEIAGATEVLGNDRTDTHLTLHILDADGRPVTRAGLVIVSFDPFLVQLNGGTVGNNGALPVRGGKATLRVRGRAAAVGRLLPVRATWDSNGNGRADPAEQISATHTVTVAQPLPSGLKVAGDQKLRANLGQETAQLTATVLDQGGERLDTGLWSIQWEVDGPATDPGNRTTGADGTTEGEFTLTLKSRQGMTGPVNVAFTLLVPARPTATATLEAFMGKAPAQLTASVAPGQVAAAGGLGAGEAVINVVVRDADGVPANLPAAKDLQLVFADQTLVFNPAGAQNAYANAPPGSQDAILAPAIPAGDAAVAVRAAFRRPGEYKFTVRDPSGELGSASGSIKVRPGPAAKVGWTRGEKPMVVALDKLPGSLTLQVYDALGNPVAQPGLAFTVAASDNFAPSEAIKLNGQGGTATVKTNASGAATVAVEPLPYMNRSYAVQITDGSGAVAVDSTADRVPITVLDSIPDRVDVVIRDGATEGAGERVSVMAGTPVYAWITVLDAYGGKLISPTIAQLLALELPAGAWDADGDPATANDRASASFAIPNGTMAGAFVVPLTPAAAGQQSVSARLDLGGNIITGSASITVTAGPDHHAVVAEAAGNVVTLAPGQETRVTLRVADAWGNLKTADAPYNVAFTDLPGSDGDGTDLILRGAAGGADLQKDGTPALTFVTARDLHLLLPEGGDADGTIRIDDGAGPLAPWTFTIARP